jgi:Arm DNA-binding domain
MMARLTERGVQTAKPGRHSDGDGLHLVVSEAGRKKWVLRYQVAGVRKDKGLGAYPAVGLKDARDKAGEARKLVARGVDPIEAERAAKKAAKPIPTFGTSSPSCSARRISSTRTASCTIPAISTRSTANFFGSGPRTPNERSWPPTASARPL